MMGFCSTLVLERISLNTAPCGVGVGGGGGLKAGAACSEREAGLPVADGEMREGRGRRRALRCLVRGISRAGRSDLVPLSSWRAAGRAPPAEPTLGTAANASFCSSSGELSCRCGPPG